MLGKWAFRSVIAYLLFGIAIYVYLFYIAGTTVPENLKGTSVDPATFLNSREIMLSEEYSKIRNLLFFISTPYEWLFYFLVLIFGVSKGFERLAKTTTKYHVLQTAIYLFLLLLVSFVVTFPLSYIAHRFSRMYNISTQTFSLWMKDEVIGFWVNFVEMFVIVTVLYWLMKKFKNRWWLPAWLLSIPFMIFMMFIQPVVIDPLYNDFYPLKDKALEAKILALAEKADIPTEHVYEVNMSEKTNSLNAYVTGIGSNARIVLWDTTLQSLNDKEIMFIMAHEMGHYVEKHIYFGIAGYVLLTLIGLWLTARIMNRWVRKRGKELNVTGVANLSSLPLFLLITSMLLFAVSPLTNWVSRYEEMRADRFGMKMTQDKKAAVQSFHDLTRSGLSQVNPPLLVKIFRYDHPTMLERIMMVDQFDEEK